uniref:Gp1 n=1 Tax=Eunivirus TaxID=1416630 RepID=U5Y149_9VIRU|nr:gp1 [Eunivirus]
MKSNKNSNVNRKISIRSAPAKKPRSGAVAGVRPTTSIPLNRKNGSPQQTPKRSTTVPTKQPTTTSPSAPVPTADRSTATPTLPQTATVLQGLPVNENVPVTDKVHQIFYEAKSPDDLYNRYAGLASCANDRKTAIQYLRRRLKFPLGFTSEKSIDWLAQFGVTNTRLVKNLGHKMSTHSKAQAARKVMTRIIFGVVAEEANDLYQDKGHVTKILDIYGDEAASKFFKLPPNAYAPWLVEAFGPIVVPKDVFKNMSECFEQTKLTYDTLLLKDVYISPLELGKHMRRLQANKAHVLLQEHSTKHLMGGTFEREGHWMWNDGLLLQVSGKGEQTWTPTTTDTDLWFVQQMVSIDPIFSLVWHVHRRLSTYAYIQVSIVRTELIGIQTKIAKPPRSHEGILEIVQLEDKDWIQATMQDGKNFINSLFGEVFAPEHPTTRPVIVHSPSVAELSGLATFRSRGAFQLTAACKQVDKLLKIDQEAITMFGYDLDQIRTDTTQYIQWKNIRYEAENAHLLAAAYAPHVNLLKTMGKTMEQQRDSCMSCATACYSATVLAVAIPAAHTAYKAVKNANRIDVNAFWEHIKTLPSAFLKTEIRPLSFTSNFLTGTSLTATLAYLPLHVLSCYLEEGTSRKWADAAMILETIVLTALGMMSVYTLISIVLFTRVVRPTLHNRKRRIVGHLLWNLPVFLLPFPLAFGAQILMTISAKFFLRPASVILDWSNFREDYHNNDIQPYYSYPEIAPETPEPYKSNPLIFQQEDTLQGPFANIPTDYDFGDYVAFHPLIATTSIGVRPAGPYAAASAYHQRVIIPCAVTETCEKDGQYCSWNNSKCPIGGRWKHTFKMLESVDFFDSELDANSKQKRIDWANSFKQAMKKRRNLDGLEKYKNDDLTYKTEMFVKSDEMIFQKANGSYKPRLIKSIDPAVQAAMGVEVNRTLQNQKDYWHDHVFRCPFNSNWMFTVHIGSGMNSSDLNEWFAYAHESAFNNSKTLHCIFAGDDCLIVANNNGKFLYAEFDASRFERSQNKHLHTFQYQVMQRFGFPVSCIKKAKKIMEQIPTMTLKNCDSKEQIPMPPQRSTGGADTTCGNTTVMIGATLGSIADPEIFFEHPESILERYREHGIDVTYAFSDEPSLVTFLKGWWQLDLTRHRHVWVPLPSQTIKLGKIQKDPCTLYPKKSKIEAYACVAMSFYKCLAGIDPEYPLLGTLLKRYSHMQVWSDDVEKADFGPYKTVIDQFKYIDRRAALAHISHRYDVTIEEILEAEHLIATAPFPSTISHRVFERLVAVDYA